MAVAGSACVADGARTRTSGARHSRAGIEMWGGVECTVNRVGDVYFDQLERSGHASRVGDLDDFAALGIRAIRYPLLWERLAPDEGGPIDWEWSDERLYRLRDLGIRVVAGLTHHGSGPRHTSLVEPSFVSGLADYARRIAERYPWLDAYTPVNEPLTTARFSALYGLWYPHARDDATFARALVTQCRAVTEAMAAIRAVNPRAQLIQTEDLGRTYSTAAMASVAAFYNERRWLSLDLLCGRVVAGHPLQGRLIEWGIRESELEWQAEHACTPDVIGVNHYLTSDRYLDEAIEDYEPRTHGATPDGQPYADVEAVRASLECPVDPGGTLEDAWARYQVPVAITEVHLGSTRDEQLRWLQECWDAATRASAAGVDVRAVTVWALLGSFDWNVLVTAAGDCYEPGPFDVRGGSPRPTALARLTADLAAGRSRDNDPVLAVPGWWRRPDRLLSPRLQGRSSTRQAQSSALVEVEAPASPVLILGAEEQLTPTFAQACTIRNLAFHVVDIAAIQREDRQAMEALIARHRPWAVIHAIDAAGVAGDVRAREHPAAPDASLAWACRTHHVRFARVSAAPDRDAEAALPEGLVICAAAGPHPTGTYTLGRVHAMLDLLIDDERGLWHV